MSETMNIERVAQIVGSCVAMHRKGGLVEPNKFGVTVDAMPGASQIEPGKKRIDMQFFVASIDMPKAEAEKPALIEELKKYGAHPHPLREGPSYIEVGANVGDQGLALSLFALGEALGLWSVVTPRHLGLSGEEAAEMAGMGFIMIAGVKL